jgi:hypothetical protein
MKKFKVLLIFLFFDLIAGGGEDWCAESRLPFPKLEVLNKIENLLAVFKYVNDSAFLLMDDAFEDISLKPEDFATKFDNQTDLLTEAMLLLSVIRAESLEQIFSINATENSDKSEQKIKLTEFYRDRALSVMNYINNAFWPEIGPILGISETQLSEHIL